MADVERFPPSAQPAEQALLGALMLAPEVLPTVRLILPDAGAFYHEVHARLYRAMLALADRGRPFDLPALMSLILNQGKLDQVGGAAGLAEIASTGSPAQVEGYAHMIREAAARRNLIRSGQDIQQAAYDADLSWDQVANLAETAVFGVVEANRTGQAVAVETVAPVWTGYRDLDRLLGGVQAGDLCVVAGLTSLGKTAFALSCALNVALGRGGNRPRPVYLVSLEMSEPQIAFRLLSAEGGVNGMRIRLGELTDADWERLRVAAATLSRASLWIDAQRGQSVEQIASSARRRTLQEPIGLLIVDHLQFIAYRGRQTTRVLELGSMTYGLKNLAAEIGCPVLLVSHLSRAAAVDPKSPPSLQHLRDSGAIEQDCDEVIFLHGERKGSVREVVVAKARNAELGTVRLHFARPFGRFENFLDPRKAYWRAG